MSCGLVSPCQHLLSQPSPSHHHVSPGLLLASILATFWSIVLVATRVMSDYQIRSSTCLNILNQSHNFHVGCLTTPGSCPQSITCWHPFSVPSHFVLVTVPEMYQTSYYPVALEHYLLRISFSFLFQREILNPYSRIECLTDEYDLGNNFCSLTVLFILYFRRNSVVISMK